MNDSYVECLVARKSSGGMTVLKVVLIIVAVLGFLFGMLMPIALIVAIAAAVGAYFAAMNASLEYEYLYVDREITVDKIMNKTKRKRVEKFEVDRIEILAPINSWHLDNYRNRELKTVDYSSGIAQQPDKRFVMIYSGDKKVILEANEAMVKAIQFVAPRKVFLD